MSPLYESHLPQTPRLPVVFIGHGSPASALPDSPVQEVWKSIADSLPRPHAIIIISAHAITEKPEVYSAQSLHEEHDFYGFPDNLYTFSYRTLGSPQLAHIISRSFPHFECVERTTLDHGAWIPLRALAPFGNIPIVPISIPYQISYEELHKLYAPLAELRSWGVLIICSGNLVHNLRHIAPGAPASFATRFHAAAVHALTRPTQELVSSLLHHPDFSQAHPTDDHFRPFAIAHAMRLHDDTTQVINEVIELGTIDMTCVIFK